MERGALGPVLLALHQQLNQCYQNGQGGSATIRLSNAVKGPLSYLSSLFSICASGAHCDRDVIEYIAKGELFRKLAESTPSTASQLPRSNTNFIPATSSFGSGIVNTYKFNRDAKVVSRGQLECGINTLLARRQQTRNVVLAALHQLRSIHVHDPRTSELDAERAVVQALADAFEPRKKVKPILQYARQCFPLLVPPHVEAAIEEGAKKRMLVEMADPGAFLRSREQANMSVGQAEQYKKGVLRKGGKVSAHREQMEKAYVDGFMEFLLPITNTPNGACMSPKKVLTLMAAVRLQMGPNIADVEGQPIPLTFRQTGNHLLWGPLKATLDGAVFDKKQNVVGCSIGVSNMADGFSHEWHDRAALYKVAHFGGNDHHGNLKENGLSAFQELLDLKVKKEPLVVPYGSECAYLLPTDLKLVSDMLCSWEVDATGGHYGKVSADGTKEFCNRCPDTKLLMGQVFTYYTTKPGDTVASVAKEHHMYPSSIIKYNPHPSIPPPLASPLATSSFADELRRLQVEDGGHGQSCPSNMLYLDSPLESDPAYEPCSELPPGQCLRVFRVPKLGRDCSLESLLPGWPVEDKPPCMLHWDQRCCEGAMRPIQTRVVKDKSTVSPDRMNQIFKAVRVRFQFKRDKADSGKWRPVRLDGKKAAQLRATALYWLDELGSSNELEKALWAEYHKAALAYDKPVVTEDDKATFCSAVAEMQILYRLLYPRDGMPLYFHSHWDEYFELLHRCKGQNIESHHKLTACQGAKSFKGGKPGNPYMRKTPNKKHYDREGPRHDVDSEVTTLELDIMRAERRRFFYREIEPVLPQLPKWLVGPAVTHGNLCKDIVKLKRECTSLEYKANNPQRTRDPCKLARVAGRKRAEMQSAMAEVAQLRVQYPDGSWSARPAGLKILGHDEQVAELEGIGAPMPDPTTVGNIIRVKDEEYKQQWAIRRKVGFGGTSDPYLCLPACPDQDVDEDSEEEDVREGVGGDDVLDGEGLEGHGLADGSGSESLDDDAESSSSSSSDSDSSHDTTDDEEGMEQENPSFRDLRQLSDLSPIHLDVDHAENDSNAAAHATCADVDPQGGGKLGLRQRRRPHRLCEESSDTDGDDEVDDGEGQARQGDPLSAGGAPFEKSDNEDWDPAMISGGKKRDRQYEGTSTDSDSDDVDDDGGDGGRQLASKGPGRKAARSGGGRSGGRGACSMPAPGSSGGGTKGVVCGRGAAGRGEVPYGRGRGRRGVVNRVGTTGRGRGRGRAELRVKLPGKGTWGRRK